MLGKQLKEIRENKGLSQKYVIDSFMTQSAYSKFELGKTEIRASVFINFLTRIDMTLEELLYVQNGYQFPLREQIIQNFFNMSYNDRTVLQEVLNLAKKYLQAHPTQDYMIEEVHHLCQAFLLLLETNDFSAASVSANKVWGNLSKRNTLYVADIYMLNAILFIFPLETILEIRKLMDRSIEKYGNLFRLQRIKINMHTNIAYLFMKENMFEKAIVELEESINLCKMERAYVQLGICYIRIGVCFNKLTGNGDDWIEKGKQLLLTIEEQDLLGKIDNEMKQFISGAFD